jgi:thiol-disulfide isomerase/thioredoxin
MTLLLTLACAPQLYSEAPTVWVAPDNTWPATEELPEEFKGEGFSVGEIIPELVAIDQHGDQFSLWQFYGQVVILDISTMWCGPCQALAEDVDETWNHYNGSELMYLTVLPQNLDGAPPSVAELNDWTANYGITAPVVSDDKDWYIGAVPSNTFPQLMVVGRDMRVYARDIPPSDPEIRTVVDEYLAQE